MGSSECPGLTVGGSGFRGRKRLPQELPPHSAWKTPKHGALSPPPAQAVKWDWKAGFLIIIVKRSLMNVLLAAVAG